MGGTKTSMRKSPARSSLKPQEGRAGRRDQSGPPQPCLTRHETRRRRRRRARAPPPPPPEEGARSLLACSAARAGSSIRSPRGRPASYGGLRRWRLLRHGHRAAREQRGGGRQGRVMLGTSRPRRAWPRLDEESETAIIVFDADLFEGGRGRDGQPLASGTRARPAFHAAPASPGDQLRCRPRLALADESSTRAKSRGGGSGPRRACPRACIAWLSLSPLPLPL